MREPRIPWRTRLALSSEACRTHIQAYRLMLDHPRTPRLSKILLGLAVAYAVTPIDLIPDFIPVIGHLDDVLIIPALVWMALCFIPSEVRKECRMAAEAGKVKGVEQTHGT